MDSYKFKPEEGMRISSCYLHGLNDLDWVNDEGIIENVGHDYFVARNLRSKEPFLVTKDKYVLIENEDII